MADPIVCLHHEDTWYYFLPHHYYGSQTWRAEAVGYQEILASAGRSRWFVGSFLAEQIVRLTPGGSKAVGWELVDPSAVSERFPLTLTHEEWTARRGDEDDAAPPEVALYRAITEAQPDQETTFEGPWVRGDGEPAPADGRVWTAQLPYELINHPELLHLFPGELSGFRDALAARLKRIPTVDVYTTSGFEVYAKVPYDPPHHTWQGTKRRGHQVEQRLTRSQKFYPSYKIGGVNRAAAVVAWDAEIAKFVAVVTEMATVRVCGTCSGTGVGPHGSAT